MAGAAGRSARGGQAERLPESRIRGVLIGVQSYSFRDRGLQGLIDGMRATGITSCELWQGHVEPRELDGRGAREEMRRWRLTVPLDHFRSIRTRFEQAGLTLNSYNISFQDHFSDDEIDRGFEMAEALGVSAITASAHVNSVPRIARMAGAHGIPVAMHNHSRVDANEFSSPAQFAAAVAQGDGRSIAVNLDVGHFVAANHDPVAWLRDHHEQVTTLHLKDRRRDQGPNVPWGEGDAPHHRSAPPGARRGVGHPLQHRVRVPRRRHRRGGAPLLRLLPRARSRREGRRNDPRPPADARPPAADPRVAPRPAGAPAGARNWRRRSFARRRNSQPNRHDRGRRSPQRHETSGHVSQQRKAAPEAEAARLGSGRSPAGGRPSPGGTRSAAP